MTYTDDVKDAIKMAIQMERDGYDFYMKASAQTSSQMGQSIFESLAGDEMIHLETFQKLFEAKVGKTEWEELVKSSRKYETMPVFPKDLNAIEGANPETNELDALHIAMESEQKAVEHYSKIVDAIKDEEIRKIINEIITQEKNHYHILQEEFTHLSSTGFWYDLDYLGG